MLLHRLEREVGDEEADDVVLQEGVLALGVVGGELGDGPSHHALHLHGRVLEDLDEGGAHAGEDHEVDALGVAAQEPDGERGALLRVGAPLLDEAQQRRDAVLLDDELAVAVVVAREGDDAGGGVGAGLEAAVLQHGDLLPDEEEDGLVLRDGGQADVVVLVVVGGGGGGGGVAGDAEDPGEVPERVVEQVGGLPEGARGDDGEDAVEDAAAAAALEQRGGLVERPVRVREDAARGALVELGARRLAEQRGEALDPGPEVLALGPARLRLVRPLDQLLRQLDRPRQARPQVVHAPLGRSAAGIDQCRRRARCWSTSPPIRVAAGRAGRLPSGGGGRRWDAR